MRVEQLCEPVLRPTARRQYTTLADLLDDLLGRHETEKYEKLLNYCSQAPHGVEQVSAWRTFRESRSKKRLRDEPAEDTNMAEAEWMNGVRDHVSYFNLFEFRLRSSRDSLVQSLEGRLAHSDSRHVKGFSIAQRKICRGKRKP